MEFQLLKRKQQQVAMASSKSHAELLQVQAEFAQKHKQFLAVEVKVNRLLDQVAQIQKLQTPYMAPELHQNFIKHALVLNQELLVAQQEFVSKRDEFAAIRSRLEQYLTQQHVFDDLQQQLQFQMLNVISDFQEQVVMDLAAGARN